MTRKVCLGWCCEWRDHCYYYIRRTDQMHVQWFLPINKGEYCQHFKQVSALERSNESI